MCTVILPSGGYPIAVNKYIVSYHIIIVIICVVALSSNSDNFVYILEELTTFSPVLSTLCL